jgi:hypothetical protein
MGPVRDIEYRRGSSALWSRRFRDPLKPRSPTPRFDGTASVTLRIAATSLLDSIGAVDVAVEGR